MILLDEFLSVDDANEIEKEFSSNNFPWFYLDKSLSLPEVEGFVNTPIFRHAFILEEKKNSDFTHLIRPLLDNVVKIYSSKLQIASVIANFLLPNLNFIGRHITPHYDIKYDNSVYNKFKTYTGLYYVNDCDGETIIFNEKNNGSLITNFTELQRITPKKNRVAIWDSRHYHSAPAASLKNRFVINFNFIVKEF